METEPLGGEWLDGVEYDYVFDVKVSDGRVFKFGYNVGGNELMWLSPNIKKMYGKSLISLLDSTNLRRIGKTTLPISY